MTVAAQGASFFLQMASTVVLARLLTPQDFGLIAMVTAITGFVSMFKDMGLSMATVQKAEINHSQISTLFWINVALSLGIMLITVVLAPVIAWFYGEPRLTWITLALASAFIFGGLTVQHQALLRRNMRFGTLALIAIISMLVSILAAIIAALYGAGYWSLVLRQLANAMVGMIAVWLACRWWPGLPVRRSGVRSMMAFGANLTGFNIVGYLAQNIDNILIGKFLGAVPLGLYNRAYQLLLLPVRQINQPMEAVAIPALSRLQQEPSKFRSYYRKGLTLAVMFGMPIVAFLFVVADKVILIVLGQQWLGSVPIFRALGLAAFVGTTNSLGTGVIFVALGNVRRQFLAALVRSFFLVVAFCIGLHWGAIGVAAAYSIYSVLSRMPTVVVCFWGTCLKLADFLGSIWRAALASAAAGACIHLLDSHVLPEANIILRFLLNFIEYAFFYIFFWMVIPGGKNIIVDACRMLKLLKEKPVQQRAL